ncbi:hypothetical protein AB0N05_17325 [Nocardia sp. NPDC051030]|uniref:hypothetical protein n=1 Tax=Nocardia sp. NPDC051030 TaxID=3155162 RepID=UPI00342345AF
MKTGSGARGARGRHAGEGSEGAVVVGNSDKFHHHSSLTHHLRLGALAARPFAEDTW